MNNDVTIYLVERYGWLVLPIIVFAYVIMKNPLELAKLFRKSKPNTVESDRAAYMDLRGNLDYFIQNNMRLTDATEPVNSRILKELLCARYEVFLAGVDKSFIMAESDLEPQDLRNQLSELIFTCVIDAEKAELDAGVPMKAILVYREFSTPYLDSFMAVSKAICTMRIIPDNHHKLEAIWTILLATVKSVTRHAEKTFATLSFEGEQYKGETI